MIFAEEKIDLLRNKVKLFLTEKRYVHTLGVEKMARHIGKVLMPENVVELAVAALLHDVAKELPFDEQVELLLKSDYPYDEEELSLKPALHSISAIPVIKRDFFEYSTDNVLSAVANHTLGNAKMSVFDEIIFISDYAEEGRTYRACVEVRNLLLENLKEDGSIEDNLLVLHTASLKAIDSTIESLTGRSEKIGTRTFLTKQYIESIISK